MKSFYAVSALSSQLDYVLKACKSHCSIRQKIWYQHERFGELLVLMSETWHSFQYFSVVFTLHFCSIESLRFQSRTVCTQCENVQFLSVFLYKYGIKIIAYPMTVETIKIIWYKINKKLIMSLFSLTFFC